MKFTVECEMSDRWVNDFCSMLKTMEDYGYAGHSEWVALFADGDGDFRPKFNINTNFEKIKPRYSNGTFDRHITLYDAG